MERWVKDFISWYDHHKIKVPRTQEELAKLEVFEAKNKRLTALHPSIYLSQKSVSNHPRSQLTLKASPTSQKGHSYFHIS